jgi:hypothetical protein
MICLLPHPLPPSPLSLPKCRRSSLLTGQGKVVGADCGAKLYDAESLVLYKSFNTLCLQPISPNVHGFFLCPLHAVLIG